MKILALEFSSARRSVAAVEAGQLRGQAIAASAAEATALALVERALIDAQWEREQVQGIAVGLGPGSYTGIRSAIALAQGWQLARPVPLQGIGAVECLAAQLQAEGFHGRVRLAIDAQREEFYVAACALTPTAVQRLEPLHLVPLAHLRQARADAEALFGPELDRWIDGARSVFPDAAALGRLATDWSAAVRGETLEPIYLRQTAFVKAPPPRRSPALPAPAPVAAPEAKRNLAP